MTWPDVTITMLRILISDIDDTNYDYSDDRLQQTLVVAAQLVNQEIDFDTSYTINVPLVTISPDPTVAPDDAFINFIVLKAACFIDQSTFRTKAAIAGLKARCGPTQLETMEHLKGFKELLTSGPCAAYTTLKSEWTFGNAQVVKAILSPFVSNNFDPRNLPTARSNFLYNLRSGD
jgi:hypothetical protein